MQRKQQGIKAAIFLFVLLVGIAVCIIGIVEIDRFADSDRTNVYVVNSSYSTALAWFYHGSIYEGVALFFIGFGGIVIGITGAAGAAMTLSGGDSEKTNAPAAPYGGAPVQGRPTTPGYPQQPYYGGPMPSQPGMQAHPMPPYGAQPQQSAPMPQYGAQPQQGRPMPQYGAQPQQGRPMPPYGAQPQQSRPMPPYGAQPQQGRPMPPYGAQPQQGRPMPPYGAQPQQGRPMPPYGAQPQQGRPVAPNGAQQRPAAPAPSPVNAAPVHIADEEQNSAPTEE